MKIFMQKSLMPRASVQPLIFCMERPSAQLLRILPLSNIQMIKAELTDPTLGTCLLSTKRIIEKTLQEFGQGPGIRFKISNVREQTLNTNLK